MVKCFQVFDKDGNGFLNASELKELARDLGRELDAAEVDECLKDLDKDKDNKISFAEFSKWWLSGRQGLSPVMRNLLALKLTSLKLLDTLSAPLKEVLSETTHQDAKDI
jgi:EF-hand domain pair